MSLESPNKAYIIYDEDAQTLDITLKYSDDELEIDRGFNFQRKSTELCSRFLTRISDNIAKVINKKVKKKASNTITIEVNLVSKDDGLVCDIEKMTCLETFIHSQNYSLKIKNIIYIIDVNPPLLTSLELPKRNIMSGYFIYPSKMDGVNCNSNETILRWFKTKEKFESYEMLKNKNEKNLEWQEFGEGFMALTSNDDVSRLLKVIAIPQNGSRVGPDSECVSSILVSPSPGLCPFEKRHRLTPNVLSKDFLRVVSYNILADLYADSDYSRNKLYPTCPPYALDIEYRKQLLLKEILGYHADLICLQEVDEKVFTRHLKPVFAHFDLDGVFQTKGGPSMSEGLATFYRKDKLRLVDHFYFHLSQELQENPLFIDLLPKVKSNPALYENFTKRTSILQVALFSRVEDPLQILVVGGTHLYFEPTSDHIRILQAGLCLTLLQQMMSLQKAQNPERDVSLLFCGDFNSAPENAIYRLMTSQLIDSDDADWISKLGEEVKGVSFSHDLELESACGIPHYINFTIGFRGVLDYIFYQTDKFAVEQVVPFPSVEDMSQHGALPSVTFPSDHVALVSDLKWLK